MNNLKTDGIAWASRDYRFSQLGDRTAISHSTPDWIRP